MQNIIADISEQMQRVIIGKREVVEKVLMAALRTVMSCSTMCPA